MVSYTLRQLEYFVAAADAGSISQAASTSHVSSAALAQALSELERIVDAQLLVRRRSKGVALTAAGAAFLRDARSLLRHAVDVEVQITDRQNDLVGPLSLGCYSSLAPFWVPVLTADFIRANPRLTMTVEEGDAAHLQQRMVDGHLDAVLTHTRHLRDDVQAHIVRPGRPYVLLPGEHPLAQRGSVKLCELADMDYIQLDLPSVRDNQLMNLRESGLDPKVRWRSSSFEAVRGLVARGLGYTILVQRPKTNVTYDGRRVAPVEIDGPIQRSDNCLATTSAQRPSMRLRSLIEFCVRTGDEDARPVADDEAGIRSV
ncbi:LysR family transcriptional regulator (plasmid) [Coraliomargarita sp. W4R53]